MKKMLNVLFVALFCGFLAACLAATAMLEDGGTSFYENRALAKKPDLTREAVLSGDYFDGLESWLKDRAAGRQTLLKLDTLYHLVRNVKVLRCPVVNEVVVGDDILLLYYDYGAEDTDALAAEAARTAENLESVREKVESVGGRFYYVMVPCQDAAYPEKYPAFLHRRAPWLRTKREALLDALGGTGVTVIDAGESLLAPENRDRTTSRVDNHFTMEGAYLTYRAVMDAVNADREEPLPVLNEENSVMRELPNRYMGSHSRKLFELSGVEERLSVLEPTEPIPFHRTNWGSDVEVAPSVYALPDTDWDRVDYSLYMGGDLSECRIDTGREDLPKLLVYGDSFTNAVECCLYYSFGEMRSLDFRYYNKMGLGDYIDLYKPDVVICIRDYAALTLLEGNGCGADRMAQE